MTAGGPAGFAKVELAPLTQISEGYAEEKKRSEYSSSPELFEKCLPRKDFYSVLGFA
jgi:hypothetical protein